MTKTRVLLCLAAALACGLASAQTIRYEVQTSAGVPVPGIARTTTQAACDTALRTRNVGGEYHCHRVTIIAGAPVPVVCEPAPLPVPTTIACPAGTTGSWTQTTYSVRGPAPACALTSTVAPQTAPAGACTPVQPPPAPVGTVLYFSPTGDNTSPGTLQAPKRDLAGVTTTCQVVDSSGAQVTIQGHNCLPAGSELRFQRGGAWAWPGAELHNLRVTVESPLVIDAYGEGASPVFRTASGNAFSLGGRWGNTTNDGGYTIRNIRLDGMGTADRGLWLVQNVRGITLENVDIENFRFGIESSAGTPHRVTGLTIRNSRISNNRSMGILGSYSDSLIENSTFEGNNNITGSTGNHAIYFSHGDRVTIRNNNFTGNSVVNGSCIGGNVTVHGVVDGLLIEGNTIRQERSAISCYGFAITAGYTTAESFRNVVVRGNTIINVGMTSIAANAAPGIVVENNRVINTQAAGQYGIWIPANGGADAGDAAEGGAIVRNNTICFAQAQGSVGVSAPGAQASGNVVRMGADATTGACAL